MLGSTQSYHILRIVHKRNARKFYKSWDIHEHFLAVFFIVFSTQFFILSQLVCNVVAIMNYSNI